MRLGKSGRIWKFLDPGLLLVVTLSLFAVKPLLAGNGVYRGHDTGHHLLRMDSMRRSWSQGAYYPSLAAATSRDCGSSVFHVCGNLTYYLTSLLQFAFNFNAIQALRWLLMLCLLMSGAGMYLFCQRRSGRLGALIGGLVYVNSPYMFHVNAQLRGAYPELFALSLFPILLWRMDALRDAPNARNFLLLLLMEVALINTHSLSAVLMTGIAFAWLAFEAVIQSVNREASQLDSRGELWAALALSFGILTAASFWLPVIWEADSFTPGESLYEVDSNHWLSIAEQFKVAAQFSSVERPSFPEALHIGIAQWTFALAGVSGALALYIRGYRTRHPHAFLGAVFFFCLFMFLIFMMTAWSQPIWDVVPALRYLQFPWRLLGPVAVCMAYLASLNGMLLRRLPRNLRLLAIALAIAAPTVCGLAITRTIVWNDETVAVSAADYMTNHPTGATRRAEYFPFSASKLMGQSRLPEDSAASLPIDRFDHGLLRALSQSALARDLGALISALAFVGGMGIAWRLQRLRITPRHYAAAQPLTTGELRGLLLAGAIVIVCFL